MFEKEKSRAAALQLERTREIQRLLKKNIERLKLSSPLPINIASELFLTKHEKLTLRSSNL